jgi:hypothetical protein
MATLAPEKPQFYVVELGLDRVDDAYALARTVTPGLRREDWAGFVERRLAEGGMLALLAADGVLFGYLCWRIEQRLRHGRVLAVDEFMTFELSRSAPGRTALCDAAEEVALERGCDAVEIRLPAPTASGPLHERFQGWARLGHQVESVVLLKPLRVAVGRVRDGRRHGARSAWGRSSARTG